MVWVIMSSDTAFTLRIGSSGYNITFSHDFLFVLSKKKYSLAVTNMCLPLGSSLVVSSPSSVTSQGQGHSLMMVLDENRKCYNK